MSDNFRDGGVPRDTSGTWGGSVSQPYATPQVNAEAGSSSSAGSDNGDASEHLGVGRPYERASQPGQAQQVPLQPQPWRQAGRPAPAQQPASPVGSRPGAQPAEVPTETPAVETPAAEIPAVEAPAAEAPASDTPQPAQSQTRQPAAQPAVAQSQAAQSQAQSQARQPQPQGGNWASSAPPPPGPQGAGGQAGSGSAPQPGSAAGSQQGSQSGYWPQRPDTPASPVARRRGGESPLAARPASTPAGPTGPAQNARTPGLDDDEALAEEVRRPAPKYGLKGLVYKTLRLNLGPSRRDVDELDIRERLNRQTRRTRGYCGYIGIASEKGGVGKTTLASLLAAEIAEGRRESVGIADLNPDLGTLPDRFGVRPHYSIRDLLAHVDEIPWRYHVHDFMEKVPEMNVRVLAASTDRKIRHQLSVADVELLAELFAPFFSFAILDNGTHITHEAMLGTLRTAHGMVLVTDNTRDGANLARKTLQFLSDNGFPDMRRRVVLAVVAKETASPIKVRAIEKAFRDHVRDLIVVPYDPALDGGGKIPFRDPNAVNKILRKETRAAVRRLAAIIMDDLVA